MKNTYRYYVLANEDARQKRPIKHEHGGTTVLAREYPEGWVYINVEYRAHKV